MTCTDADPTPALLHTTLYTACEYVHTVTVNVLRSNVLKLAEYDSAHHRSDPLSTLLWSARSHFFAFFAKIVTCFYLYNFCMMQCCFVFPFSHTHTLSLSSQNLSLSGAVVLSVSSLSLFFSLSVYYSHTLSSVFFPFFSFSLSSALSVSLTHSLVCTRESKLVDDSL